MFAMSDDSAREEHWRRMHRLMVLTLVIWFVFAFFQPHRQLSLG